jgi:hypothetical protein
MRYEGELCWKCGIEYNPEGGLYGTPYFIITTCENKKYYFYRYDVKSDQYVKMKKYENLPFDELHEIGLAKEEVLRQEIRRRK